MPDGRPPLRIATRGSSLAMTQARAVAVMLAPHLNDRPVTLEIVKTRGDVRQDVSLTQLGEGIFVRAIEEELLAGRADVAVHSFKDVPSNETPGLIIAAVPAREEPWDAIVTRDGRPFKELEQQAVLATGSPRRIAELRTLRPDLRFTGVRGNVDTRLRKLDAGEFDGLVIAVAGLNRLDLDRRISTVFSVDECVPAVGQGALAIQCRQDDVATRTILNAINDAHAHTQVCAERSFLKAIGGGCRVPVGALARTRGANLRLWAVVADVDGKHVSRTTQTGPSDEPEHLGLLAARELEHL